MDFTVLLAVKDTCNRKIPSANHDHFGLILDPMVSI